MASRIGINGFGRIGRQVLRAMMERHPDKLEVVAVQDSEIDHYLGMPGQAISYKVGEREWLSARDDSKKRRGADFDLKEFHTRALSLGPMGLAQMRREMARV